MHCSTVTVAVANHRPCHANKDNLDRWREGDKVQQRMQGKGVGATEGQKSDGDQVGQKHIRPRCKLTKKTSHIKTTSGHDLRHICPRCQQTQFIQFHSFTALLYEQGVNF